MSQAPSVTDQPEAADGDRSPAVEGHVAPGFEAVRDVFEANHAAGLELGSAFAVTLDGELVVDLWAGWTDPERRQPWREDTLQLIFSGTKGLVAACMAKLAGEGALALDAPVASYWPEFRVHGKQHITVLDVLTHRAGLAGVPESLSWAELLDDQLVADALARQVPFWPEGRRAAYHALTYGWLCGELVRRVTGRSIGRYFADELAGPLGLEAWIGLPEEHEGRVTTLVTTPEYGIASPVREYAYAKSIYGGAWDDLGVWNQPELHRCELAGANGIATARSMARLYGCLALGGELDGVRVLDAGALARAALPILRDEEDAFWGVPMSFGLGFAVQDAERTWGPVDRAFGHSGAGGSFHAAWPDHGVGISFAMNLMHQDNCNVRVPQLLDALHGSLRGLGRA